MQRNLSAILNSQYRSVHSEYPPPFIYLFTAVGGHMNTPLRAPFLPHAAAQLFPLSTRRSAISQITCISLWKIHEIWRSSRMGTQ